MRSKNKVALAVELSILSINIFPMSNEYYRDKVRILTRATGFPGAQDDMLQLIVISTLVIYSRDYFENV